MENTEQNNCSEVANDVFKRNFERKLLEYDESRQGSMKKPWSQERVAEVIQQIKKAKGMNPGERRAPAAYYWMAKYDVVTTGDEDQLIFKRKQPDEPILCIIPREQYFEKLSEVHQSCGHAGRDKMIHTIKNRFYIPKKAIEIFVSFCPTCEMNRNTPKKNKVTCQTNSRDYNAMGQFHIIDMQSCADGEYKWLLSYQDIATRFINLRPLKTKSISEVAMELVKIFSTFGPPYKLQSEMGREFTANVTKEITTIWPICKIQHIISLNGVRKSQARVECQDIENMLKSWMSDNNSTNWSSGCLFVQYLKNTTLHRLTGKSPYQVLFGCEPNFPLSINNKPPCVLVSVKSEQQSDNDSVPNANQEVPIEFDCSNNPGKSSCLPTESLEHNNFTLSNIKIEIKEENSDEEKQYDRNETKMGVKRAIENITDGSAKKLPHLNVDSCETLGMDDIKVEVKMEFTED